MADPNPPDAFAVAHIVANVHEELRVLQDAAADLENSRTIDGDDRYTALHAAHRLLHLLEGGGTQAGVQHTRDIIATLDHPGLPQPERLQEQVDALAHLLFSDRAK